MKNLIVFIVCLVFAGPVATVFSGETKAFENRKGVGLVNVEKDQAGRPLQEETLSEEHESELDSKDLPKEEENVNRAAKLKTKRIKGNARRSWILDKYDTNYNGILDAQEMKAFRRDIEARKQSIIKKYDRNKNGKLDENERAALLRDLKAHLKKSRSVLRVYDLNRNGMLDPAETKRYRKDQEAGRKSKLENEEKAAVKSEVPKENGTKTDSGSELSPEQ